MSGKNTKNEPAAPHIRKFSPGTYQSDEEIISQFVVRNHELSVILETLRGNIHSPSCQHVLIVAPRGRGKTMLLARVAAELRTNDGFSEHLLPVRFMEESQEIFNLADFWLETLFHLAGELATHHPELARELKETHANLTDRWRESELGEQARARVLETADRVDKKLVLMVENLQMLREDVDEDFGWGLREVLQSEPRIMLVASATSRFEGLDDARQPFFELFRTVNLERLSTDDCRRLWEVLTGEEASSREIRPLEILTGGSPRLLVVVAGFARHGSMRQLMEDLVTLIDEHTEYFRNHLENLPKTERRVYLAVVDLWRPSKPSEIATRARMEIRVVSTMLKRLRDRGAVIAQGSGRKQMYSAAERLYSIYYKLRREGDEASVVKNLIHFMAVFYGESELREVSGKLITEAMKSKAIREGIERAAAERFLGKERKAIASISEQLLAEKKVNAAFEEKNFSKVVETVSNVMASQDAGQLTIPEILAAELLHKKIVAYEQLEDFEAVAAACDEMFKQLENSETSEVRQHVAEAMLRKGNALRELGDFQGAAAIFDETAKRFGKSEAAEAQAHAVEALVCKGHAELILGNLEDSIAAYEEVLERVGNSNEQDLQWCIAASLAGKGTVLGMLEDYEAAIALYDEVVRRFRDSERQEIRLCVKVAMIKKAETQINLRRPQEALHECDKIERRLDTLDKDNRVQVEWLTMCVRTLALAAQGKNADAMAQFRRVYAKFVPDKKIMMFKMMEFIPGMIAVGSPLQDLLNILLGDDRRSEALEPLILALRLHGGEMVQAPAEMLDVAGDISKFIEEEKAKYTANRVN